MGGLQGGLAADNPNVPGPSPLSQPVQAAAQQGLQILRGAKQQGIQILDQAAQNARELSQNVSRNQFVQDVGQGIGQGASESLLTQPGLAQAEGARQSLETLTDPRLQNDPGRRTLAFANLVGSALPAETRPNEILDAAQAVGNAARGAQGPLAQFIRDTSGE